MLKQYILYFIAALGVNFVIEPAETSTGAETIQIDSIRKPEPYRYKAKLASAVMEKGPTHSEIKFSLILAPKTKADQKRIDAADKNDLTSLIELESLVFTLNDGDHKALEPADLFPWETKKRIRFFLVKDESEQASKSNSAPTIVVKVMYPNHVIAEAPSISVEDLNTGISIKVTPK